MQTFVATFLLFGIVVGAMAIGVIFSNRKLKGSCGFSAEDCACDRAKQARCTRRQQQNAA
jgi:hypothetical protein